MLTSFLPDEAKLRRSYRNMGIRTEIADLLLKQRRATWEFRKRLLLEPSWLKEIESRCGVRIEALMNGFEEDREKYFGEMIQRLTKPGRKPYVVLLDPDNGIGRSNDPLYLSVSELKRTWHAMQVNDVLLVYQHNPRRKNWRERTCNLIGEVVSPAQPTMLPENYRQICVYVTEKAPRQPQVQTVDDPSAGRKDGATTPT
jgi:hypothetical protein